ncbi:DUF1127 domain-containing protein [Tritonibacter horizontis]|uniref:YjiS-like domain-containing protein n=1 Tax=Tritonibacter horizontis TaxID=1768241 RepID=A0A132BVI9_9RHOB|nr:DUF1127 domain-containing protein [Tritonibacter horizontis]KUP92383.1 hypothetical protein TRIHO_26870 [Tritonibacter horizontis]
MAAIDTTRTAQGTLGLIGRIGALASTIYATVMVWNDLRMTRNALGALTDRELSDIGLIRGDIDALGSDSPLI